MLDVAGALVAGAAVLSKPSEYTPLAWVKAVRGWREDIGAPPHPGLRHRRRHRRPAVVDEVDMVMFTGPVRGGERS